LNRGAFTARELGADESDERFDAALKKIAAVPRAKDSKSRKDR
jgi:hypothetical protein